MAFFPARDRVYALRGRTGERPFPISPCSTGYPQTGVFQKLEHRPSNPSFFQGRAREGVGVGHYNEFAPETETRPPQTPTPYLKEGCA
jgi:hypothetical protein